jgi:hypothetical protein
MLPTVSHEPKGVGGLEAARVAAVTFAIMPDDPPTLPSVYPLYESIRLL